MQSERLLQLNCPLYIRYFNSVAVSEDDASMMLGLNDAGIDILVLDALNQTAAGAYECRVGNELGEAVSNTLLVDVLCKLYILLYCYKFDPNRHARGAIQFLFVHKKLTLK